MYYILFVCVAYEYSYLILVGKTLGKCVLARPEIYRYNFMISGSKIRSEERKLAALGLCPVAYFDVSMLKVWVLS